MEVIKEGTSTKYSISFKSSVLIPLFIISVILPILIGVNVNTDLFMKILRKLKITKKTSRDNIWIDVFSDKERYIIVNFKDGKRLLGFPEYFSDNSEDGMIYVTVPSWIDDKGNETEIKVDGVFLIDKSSIDFIEFFYKTKHKEEGT